MHINTKCCRCNLGSVGGGAAGESPVETGSRYSLGIDIEFSLTAGGSLVVISELIRCQRRLLHMSGSLKVSAIVVITKCVRGSC